MIASFGSNKETEETAATKDVQAEVQVSKEEDTAKELDLSTIFSAMLRK